MASSPKIFDEAARGFYIIQTEVYRKLFDNQEFYQIF